MTMKRTSDTTLLNWVYDNRVSIVFNNTFDMWEAIAQTGLSERSRTARHAIIRLRDTINALDSKTN